jgi:hypothetical protein
MRTLSLRLESDSQISNISLVFGINGIGSMTVTEKVDRVKVVEKGGTVDNANTCIEARNFDKTTLCDQAGQPFAGFGSRSVVFWEGGFDLVDILLHHRVCELLSKGLGNL